MVKETYWSRFASDFEQRNVYVIGSKDMDLVKQQVADLKNLGKVLELGCGNGTYSSLMVMAAEHVWATDFSDEMVAVAQRQLGKIKNVTVEKQNCFETAYGNNQFDTVVMVNLLHIIPTPGQALEEAKRVLKPGGRMIVLSFTTNGMGMGNKLCMIYRYLRTYGKPPATGQTLSLKSVRDLLVRAGFAVDQASLIGNRSKAVWALAKTLA